MMSNIFGFGGKGQKVGTYLTLQEYLAGPRDAPRPLLNLEQEADWHMWRAACGAGVVTC